MKLPMACRTACCVLLAALLTAVAARQNINILWIGNSFTGLGELYNLEKEFINTCDTSLNVVSSFCKPLWGQGLDAQYADAQVMDSVRSGRYRFVVVQGYLNSGASDFRTTAVSTTLQYGALIINAIKAAGSTPIVFLHQVNQGSASDQWDTLIGTYTRLAETNNAVLAPCGIAWRSALKAHPGMNFWGTADGSDNHHQGSYGIYLNACVFYMVMTGRTPVGVTVRHAKRVDNGVYRVFTPDTATFLQQHAFSVVDSCIKAGGLTAVSNNAQPGTRVLSGGPARAGVTWSLQQHVAVETRSFTLQGSLRGAHGPAAGVVIVNATHDQSGVR